MPGIELLDYTGENSITIEVRDEIIKIVHDVLEQANSKRPKHTTFKYHRAGDLDISCFDGGNFAELNTNGYRFILVVDGEKTNNTLAFKKVIRETIKSLLAKPLQIKEEHIAVRYRVFDSSFG